MLQVQISGDRQVMNMLGELIDKAANLRPMLLEIGEAVAESTKRRFNTLTGPDGQPWAANAEGTFDAYLSKFSRARKKDGSLSKRGEQLRAGKKPLTGETKALRTTINYQLVGDGAVSIGSPMEYAPFQQYGTKPHVILPRGKKALAFGGIVVRKVDHPGIPARPFLGFSDQDRADILDIVRSYFNPAQN
jgi:phage virion morphogenesis protein